MTLTRTLGHSPPMHSLCIACVCVARHRPIFGSASRAYPVELPGSSSQTFIQYFGWLGKFCGPLNLGGQVR